MDASKGRGQQFRHRLRRHGLSLPEAVISTLLVGIVLVGGMDMVGAVFRTRTVNARLGDGPALARALLTEVAQARYEDPEEADGPIGLETDETNTTRADFDDVDDYHGWTALPPKARDGTPLAGYENWQEQVSVQWIQPDSLSVSADDLGLKQITVTVTDPGGKQTQLSLLRSENGAVEQDPVVDSTFVTFLSGELQIGADAQKVACGRNLVNHANAE